MKLNVNPSPYPNGSCPTSLKDIEDWIKTWDFSLPDGAIDGGRFAIIEDGQLPNPEDRGKVLIVTDENGDPKFLGKFIDAEGDGCCGPGNVCCLSCHKVGELKTILSTALTIEEETIPVGWTLTNGVLTDTDLTENPAFWEQNPDEGDENFSPSYYTIQYTGC